MIKDEKGTCIAGTYCNVYVEGVNCDQDDEGMCVAGTLCNPGLSGISRPLQS